MFPSGRWKTYNVLLDGPGRFALATMGAEFLAAKAGEEALMTFWTLLGPGTTWQEAFNTAFGMTIDDFYSLFEEHRAAGFPAPDLPGAVPRFPLAETDRAALTALYNATGGANWANSDNWLSDEPGNQWHGVNINSDGHVNSAGPPGKPAAWDYSSGVGQPRRFGKADPIRQWIDGRDSE